jgi:hypothetical protein
MGFNGEEIWSFGQVLSWTDGFLVKSNANSIGFWDEIWIFWKLVKDYV